MNVKGKQETMQIDEKLKKELIDWRKSVESIDSNISQR